MNKITHSRFIPDELLRKFEFYNYNHALEILGESFPTELSEILNALENFSMELSDIKTGGGNKSAIAKEFDKLLIDKFEGWEEVQLTGDLHLTMKPRKGGNTWQKVSVLEGFVDGHNIDFYKDRVALDLEWNSKDQTFDRDLLAIRTYYDCGIVSVGVIVTRSEELNDIFKRVYIWKDGQWKKLMTKYGASTTWMGKLIYRLDSRRNGGCPVLAVGIRKPCVSDWSEDYIDEHDPRHHH